MTDWLDQPECRAESSLTLFLLCFALLLAFLLKLLCVSKWQMQPQKIFYDDQSRSESSRFDFATWGPWLGSFAPHWHVYSTRSSRVSLNAPSPFMPRAMRYWKKLGPSFTCGYDYSRWSDFSKMPYRKVESFSL